MVLEYKIVDYDYFMNDMRIYEINWLLPNIQYSAKQQLENTRFICYLIAQTNSTKSIKPTDIISFEWDKKEVKNEIGITKNEIEQLKQKTLQREKEINNKHTHKKE